MEGWIWIALVSIVHLISYKILFKKKSLSFGKMLITSLLSIVISTAIFILITIVPDSINGQYASTNGMDFTPLAVMALIMNLLIPIAIYEVLCVVGYFIFKIKNKS